MIKTSVEGFLWEIFGHGRTARGLRDSWIPQFARYEPETLFFFFNLFLFLFFCFPGKCLIFCWILDENECPFKKWYFRFGIFVFVRKIFFFFLKIIEQKTARPSKDFMFVVCGTMEHLGGSRLEWTKNYLCNWIHKVVEEAKRVK